MKTLLLATLLLFVTGNHAQDVYCASVNAEGIRPALAALSRAKIPCYAEGSRMFEVRIASAGDVNRARALLRRDSRKHHYAVYFYDQ